MTSSFKKVHGLAALLSFGFAIATTSASAATCTYKVINEWTSGLTGEIAINNNGGSAINGWSVSWSYAKNRITNAWNVTLSGNGSYTGTNMSYNGTIAPGATVTFGFNADKNGGPAEIPVVGGATCTGVAASSKPASSKPASSKPASSKPASSKPASAPASSVVPASSTPLSSKPASSIPASSKPTSSSVAASSVPAGTRLDNPFVGAKMYVNQQWADNARAYGGAKIADVSTAVWMDRIGAIDPVDPTVLGLRDHLEAALDQGANLMKLVIYDLPNRDCNALASNGELLIAQDGFNRYKNEYVAPIVNILKDPKYKDIRIAAVIEPDSLPNLVTNSSVAKCREAAGAGGYVEATQFTLNALYPLTNVYPYIDIGHSGWLGWDDNLNKSAELIGNAIKGTTNGVKSIAGFISNTANTTPTKEPFLDALRNSNIPGGSGQVRSAKFYEYNPHFSELTFVTAWRTKMISLGFPSTIGMLIDTSRNGWGGPNRPTAVSTSTVLDTFVNQSRIDRRYHRGNWCNQSSGIGQRPTVAPEPGVDAYVWIKPPGESDGVGKAGVIDPTDPAKGFDRFCDPTFTTANGTLTGAIPDAPHAGRWFPEGFKILLDNAYPAL